jgi:hypothetical protein
MLLKKFIPAILWLLIITFLFCLPGSAIPEVGFLEDIGFDKFVHFTLFFVLIFLMQKPFYKNEHAFVLNRFLQFSLAAIMYGIAIEFIQKFWVPNRSFDAGDIAADAVGSIAGYAYGRTRWLRYQKK